MLFNVKFKCSAFTKSLAPFTFNLQQKVIAVPYDLDVDPCELINGISA